MSWIFRDKPVKLTQTQKILTLMCRRPNKWFWPYEFMKPGLDDLFVGYKAPTRIAEMHHRVPMMFLTRHRKQYVQRRLNIKQMDVWYDLLPENLKQIINEYYY